MSLDEKVAAHYTHGSLLEAIEAGLATLGKTPADTTIDDLAPVDEFHIGGRQASVDFLDQLGFAASDRVLDIGCGLGGASRFVADRYGSAVTGIDLTAEYIVTARALCAWVGLDERICLKQGNALALGFDDEHFSGAYMLHVGMNIADKPALFREVHRVTRRGAKFGIYDVMRRSEAELSFPVPWATTAGESAVASPDSYKQALTDAGFNIIAERDRHGFAVDFFARLSARAAGGPPPLGIHILLGSSAAAKIENMVRNVAAGVVAPVELIAERL